VEVGVKYFIASMLVLCFWAVQLDGQAPHRYRPKKGFVPDAETAVKIAEAVLVPVYGEQDIHDERPFIATLKKDVWTVRGTLDCAATGCDGGTAVVKISKVSAEILSMTHVK
jgi:hypothetical protein